MYNGLPPNHNVLAFDSFTRADTTTTLGVAESGQTWSVIGGNAHGISTNRAYTNVAAFSTTVVNVRVSNLITVQATLTTTDNANSQYLVFRQTDSSNHHYVGQSGGVWIMYKKVAGVDTQIGTAAGTPASGDVLKVTMDGSTIKFYVNGTLLITVTESDNLTGTGAGIATWNSTTARWDNFSVRRGLL